MLLYYSFAATLREIDLSLQSIQQSLFVYLIFIILVLGIFWSYLADV